MVTERAVIIVIGIVKVSSTTQFDVMCVYANTCCVEH